MRGGAEDEDGEADQCEGGEGEEGVTDGVCEEGEEGLAGHWGRR